MVTPGPARHKSPLLVDVRVGPHTPSMAHNTFCVPDLQGQILKKIKPKNGQMLCAFKKTKGRMDSL